MRNVILPALLAFGLSSAVHAGFIDAEAHAGYTTFAMTELNQTNGTFLCNIFGEGEKLSPVQSGIVAGLDLVHSGIGSLDWLKAGLRVETMLSNQAEMKMTNGADFTDQAGLDTLLAGAKTNFPTSIQGLNQGVGLWVGYGYATLEQRCDGLPGSVISNGLFMGNVLVAEADFNVAYALTQRLSLSAAGGWR
jgi:hypothetical protein